MVAATRTRKTSIDLSADVRADMGELLNQQLADSFDLYTQVKQAHWNVRGMQFISLHELFDKIAEDVLEYVDMIAERSTTLGIDAMGTARMAAANSTLPEFPTDLSDGQAFVAAVVDRVAAYAKSTRAAIDKADDAGDMGTSDLFTEVSRGIDKNLYFLESHLQ